jgi:hypothetical protein
MAPLATHVHLKCSGQDVLSHEYDWAVYPLNYWFGEIFEMWLQIRKLTIEVTDDNDARNFYQLTQEFTREGFRGFQVPEGNWWTLWHSIPFYIQLRELNIGPISLNPLVLLENMRYLQGELRKTQDCVLRNRIVTMDLELNLEGFGYGKENKDYLEANVCTDLACARTQLELWGVEMWARDCVPSVKDKPFLTCYKEHFSYTFEFRENEDLCLQDLGFGLNRVQLKGLIV